ncbi:hypothetical protein FJY63_03885, partial [Candidatus Sumerlaeota bacterium]|nr:hypothetical protein [Candidatus Sumerlaeota bacterium]
AVRANPGYVPFAALKAMVWEDRMCNVQLSNYDAKTMAALASSLGLPDNATTPVVADACRARAIKAWLAVESSPLIAQQEKYGERWRALWEQNVNSLRQTQMIRAPIDDGGMADLTRAFNVFALTRDFVRYPNNLSGAREGYSFEEKHIADVIHCPQHREVAFQLPCLPHLTPSRGGTNRADLELFRTAMRITGQKLDVEPRQGSQIHLLAFNTTAQRRLVNAQVRIGYSDGTTQVTSFTVPPWRQDEALARDALARHRLDPVHRDTAIHTCNGAELNFTWSPFYMYHVTIKLDPRRYVDEIYFPVYDPTSAGLEDSAIGDVCIVAMTVTEG